jgi:uncharacterized protein (DUF2235 family)
MRRIVICFDGTWNQVREPARITNVVKLAQAVKPVASNGTDQLIYYNSGVGTGDLVDRFLGGVFGKGLRANVKRALAFLSLNYQDDDEIYIFGFSRGAYSARALAGVIGAAGIPLQAEFEQFETVWNYYRVKPEKRKADRQQRIVRKPGQSETPLTALEQKAVANIGASEKRTLDAFAAIEHLTVKPRLRCVGVWDTVGSYGIPAGFGLGAMGRMFATWTNGFHNTHFGDHVDIGLHAIAVDEQRRPFAPTFWTIPKAASPPSMVEQAWFCGVHASVGGSYPDAGLSDTALIWMIARVVELGRSGFGGSLEFDDQFIKANAKPNAFGTAYRSAKGWPVSTIWPYVRPVLASSAIRIGAIWNDEDASEVHINEQVHWSVLVRLQHPAPVDGAGTPVYAPGNVVPVKIPPARVAQPSPEELRFYALAGAPAPSGPVNPP